MLRALLAAPLIALYTATLGLAGIVAGLLYRGGNHASRLTVFWARLILWTLRIEVVVRGTSEIPSGPAVFAANHSSMLDIPILFGHLPVDFRIVHKRSLYVVPVLGLFLRVAGHIGIDRGNPFRARKSLEHAADRIRRGTSVVVFPEGTRNMGGDVGHFKRGSFLLALQAGVPVVPISLVGVKKILPGGAQARPGTVHLIVHPALATAGRDLDQAAALAEEVRRVVAAGCAA